jgi:16S rRNA (guanine527-N7)-methyltransferase
MPVNEREMTTKTDEFARALEHHAPAYQIQLAPETVACLTDYYRLLPQWNARLHLVAPCTPTEFATRHVLESLVALRFMSAHARFVDVGSGGGLPAIPCLIARTDLHTTLIEASTKKAIFLREALSHLGLRERAEVRAERFEQMPVPAVAFVTCRALERFTEMLPQLITWSPPASTLLLFGGTTLQEKIEQLALSYTAVLLPETERRFLFVLRLGG